MLCFPQLSTGSIAQYPIEKRRLSRTVVNEASDGSRVKLADPGARAIEWTLAFESLSDEERSALVRRHTQRHDRRLELFELDNELSRIPRSEPLAIVPNRIG